jgi:hypothetical protein
MHLAVAVILPLLITVGSALLSFYIVRERSLVALAREREQLAELRADAVKSHPMFEAPVKADEQEGQRRVVDEWSPDSLVEEGHLASETDSGVAANGSFLRVLRRVKQSRTIGEERRDVQAIERGTPADSRKITTDTHARYDFHATETTRSVREEKPHLSRLIEELTASTSIVREEKIVEETSITSQPREAQKVELRTNPLSELRTNPLSELMAANAGSQDHRNTDRLSGSIDELNWTESESYTESIYRLTTSAAELQDSQSHSQEEGTQMLKPMTQGPTQTPSRPSEDQRLTHKMTATVTEWNANANEPAQESNRTALSSVDEIYVKSNFKPTTTTADWHILKVADMLNSEHLRGLSAAAKHSALLMALEAAGVAVDDVLQDAVQRQRVLNEYEQAQQARLQQLEAVKLRESERLTAEMEAIRSQYQARIAIVVEDLERERAAIREWQAKKEQEQRRIADAASCVSYASSESNVRILMDSNLNGRLRESA